jgi:hypothetical protein
VVLPRQIKVKAGGVVDFTVAGFHDIVIFKPGFTLEELIQVGGGQLPRTPPIFVLPPDPAVALPVNLSMLAERIYYRGINPAGGPLWAPRSRAIPPTARTAASRWPSSRKAPTS